MPQNERQSAVASSSAESRPRRRHRRPNNFTYISSGIKYVMFFFNFLFWMVGALLMAVGLYAMVDKWKSGEGFKFDNVFDILFNLAFVMLIIGSVIFVVSFAGCIGALRENLCLLKFYSFCLLIFFLVEVTFVVFGFFYPHKINYFLEESFSDELIKNYRDDLDFQNLVDLVQKEFQCCGISSEGFRDWSKNAYFNCTENVKDNPSVERCGVPFSCCLSGGVTDGLVNIMCGFGVQEMHSKVVSSKIYTEGCLRKVNSYIKQNLYIIGGVAAGIALTHIIVLWLARTLEGQIMDQRALWRSH